MSAPPASISTDYPVRFEAAPSSSEELGPYPDAGRDLNRWLPLVKWLLAIPHYIVLCILYVGVVFMVIGAWFAILFTGRYPRGLRA